MQTLKDMGFSTKSELNLILDESKKITVVQSQDGEDDAANQSVAVLEEGEEDGGIASTEYDYLLSMPLWNLSEEKVKELEKQLAAKRHEYDVLFNMHIFQIWRKDLDLFLEALTKQEEKEERDRLGQVKSTHQGGARRMEDRGK